MSEHYHCCWTPIVIRAMERRIEAKHGVFFSSYLLLDIVLLSLYHLYACRGISSHLHSVFISCDTPSQFTFITTMRVHFWSTKKRDPVRPSQSIGQQGVNSLMSAQWPPIVSKTLWSTSLLPRQILCYCTYFLFFRFARPICMCYPQRLPFGVLFRSSFSTPDANCTQLVSVARSLPFGSIVSRWLWFLLWGKENSKSKRVGCASKGLQWDTQNGSRCPQPTPSTSTFPLRYHPMRGKK